VSHGWQSEPIDGPKGGWNVDRSIYLSIYPSIFLSIHLSIYLSINLSIYLSLYPSIFLSIHPSICLSICPSVYLFPYLLIYLSTYPSSCLSTSLSVYLPIHLSAFPSTSLPLSLSLSLSPCSRLSIKLPVYVSICLPIESKAAYDIVSRTGVGLQKHTKFFYWEMNRVRKDTVGCFHLCSGPLPRVCLCIHIIIPPIITNRRHTTNSNIHTYTTITLTDMSVPPYITGYINNSKA